MLTLLCGQAVSAQKSARKFVFADEFKGASRVTKPYLPTFQPSKQATSRQATSRLVQTRIPAEKWREIIGQIQPSARCIGRPKLCTQRKPAAETRAAGISNF